MGQLENLRCEHSSQLQSLQIENQRLLEMVGQSSRVAGSNRENDETGGERRGETLYISRRDEDKLPGEKAIALDAEIASGELPPDWNSFRTASGELPRSLPRAAP